MTIPSICSLALSVVLFATPMPTWAQVQAPVVSISELPHYVDPHAISLASSPEGSAEQWEMLAGGRIVRNVVAPTLTPFLPDPAKATGAAVIVAPGGAFMHLSIDMEGYEVARWLAHHGVAAFVLKYRLRPTPRDSKEYLVALSSLLSKLSGATSAEKPEQIPAVPLEAIADGKAAIKLVRQRATQWRIDPERVGLIGFSAGAIMTLDVGLADEKAARPDFIAPIYGWLGTRPVPLDAPPMFAALAADDPLIGGSGLELIGLYQRAKRPVELHLYDSGGHGFGMKKQGKTSDLWIGQFYAWMKDRGLLQRQPG